MLAEDCFVLNNAILIRILLQLIWVEAILVLVIAFLIQVAISFMLVKAKLIKANGRYWLGLSIDEHIPHASGRHVISTIGEICWALFQCPADPSYSREDNCQLP